MSVQIISAETVSILVLCMLFIGQMSRREKSRTWHYFQVCIVATIIALAVDAISYHIEPRTDNKILLTVINCQTYLVRNLIFAGFGFYLYHLICEKKKTSIWYLYGLLFIELGDFITTIYGTVTGRLFSIENGAFVYGPMNLYSDVSQVMVFLYLVGMILVHMDALGKRNTSALLFYMSFPLLDVILEAIWEEWSFAYVATAFSVVALYIVIQTDKVDAATLRAQILEEVSYLDTLTGMQNRRSCDARLEAVKGEPSVGILFCDVNGLKIANDEQGHAAGDALLLTFARYFEKTFSHECTYRISGDEFVALLSGCEQGEFELCLQDFRTRITEMGQIAAIGAAYGRGADVMKLLVEAEHGMYADKRAYYLRVGYDRRRR